MNNVAIQHSGLHVHTWRHARWHPGRKQAWFPWRRSCCNHRGSLGERSESFPCPSGPHTDGLLSRLPPTGKCQEVFQSNCGNQMFSDLIKQFLYQNLTLMKSPNIIGSVTKHEGSILMVKYLPGRKRERGSKRGAFVKQ